MASGSLRLNFLSVEHLSLTTQSGLSYTPNTIFYIGDTGEFQGTSFINLFALNKLIDPSTLQYEMISSLVSTVDYLQKYQPISTLITNSISNATILTTADAIVRNGLSTGTLQVSGPVQLTNQTNSNTAYLIWNDNNLFFNNEIVTLSAYTSTQTDANAFSTTKGLGNLYISTVINVLSSPNLQSTVTGLGTAGYISSTRDLISTPDMNSSLKGLGSMGYLSSPRTWTTVTNLNSTIKGLGSRYVSTASLVSTTAYILSQTGFSNAVTIQRLQSTIDGLGSAGYISTVNAIELIALTSTVAGLGELYISTLSLESTVAGLGTASYISTLSLESTVAGLGTASYISTTSLQSTVQSLKQIKSTFNLLTTDTLQLREGGPIYITNSNLQYSRDFIKWTSTPTDLGSLIVNSVTYSSNLSLFLATGVSQTPNIVTSTDGINWSFVTSGGFDVVGYGGRGVKFSTEGPILVVGGLQLDGAGYPLLSNYLQWSIDGQNWNPSITVPITFATYCVSYIDTNLWAAGGIFSVQNSNIVYSYDASNWNVVNTTTIDQVYNIAGANGIYIAIGYSSNPSDTTSTINVSIDGVNWNSITSGGFDQMKDVSDVYYPYYYSFVEGSVATNGSLYIATGNHSVQESNIQWSSDGYNWYGSINTYGAGTQVQWADPYWYVIGPQGIQQSSDGSNWTLLTSHTDFSLAVVTAEYIQNTLTATNSNLFFNGVALTSTFASIETIDQSLQSTVASLLASQVPIISLESTVEGLATAGYISSLTLDSTIQGLGSIYLSSLGPIDIGASLQSTVDGLATAGYISSISLYSTVEGLATVGYISTFSLQSTVDGLGSADYVSSLSLQSTVEYILTQTSFSNTITIAVLESTVAGFGTAGYLSSLETLNPTLISTVEGLGSAGFLSSFSLIDANIASTIEGLGTLGYISSFDTITIQIVSTVEGLGTAGFLSSLDLVDANITSTIIGLGSFGYLSSFVPMFSTVEGLGSAGYISSLANILQIVDLESTVIGLGSAGYISSFDTLFNELITNRLMASTISVSSLLFIDYTSGSNNHLYTSDTLLYYNNQVIGGLGVAKLTF